MCRRLLIGNKARDKVHRRPSLNLTHMVESIDLRLFIRVPCLEFIFFSVHTHGQQAMTCAAECDLCVVREAGRRGQLQPVPGRIVLDGLG